MAKWQVLRNIFSNLLATNQFEVLMLPRQQQGRLKKVTWHPRTIDAVLNYSKVGLNDLHSTARREHQVREIHLEPIVPWYVGRKRSGSISRHGHVDNHINRFCTFVQCYSSISCFKSFPMGIGTLKERGGSDFTPRSNIGRCNG